MRYRRTASVAMTVACVIAAVTTSAAAAPSAARAVPAESPRTSSTAAMRTAPNTADIQFVRMMIPHHYQALVMTRLVPERSSDEDVRALAERINVGQSVEIDAMQGWQGRHGLPVTDPEESYERLLEQPARLEEMGMATPAELTELREARGNEFDVLFLRLMIEHHEGAIAMAEDVIVHGRDVSLRQMAINMMSTQSNQIQTMRQILERKTG